MAFNYGTVFAAEKCTGLSTSARLSLYSYDVVLTEEGREGGSGGLSRGSSSMENVEKVNCGV